MEVAVIDWKSIDSRFVKDDLYEHINAPKWLDFSAAEDTVDDEAWFCRPGCNHPKTAEDFFNENVKTPASSSKLKKSAGASDVSPFGDRTKREARLKKRGVVNQPLGSSKHHRIVEDGENQDPNFSTPIHHKARDAKEAIKSSAEKKQFRDDTMMGKEQTPRLRSTLSARNLFAGGDFLSKVAEFCNELKKLTIRTKDENAENTAPMEEKERKPLLEVMETSGAKGQRKKKIKNNDSETNTPVLVDVKKGVLQIRTCPPTPQCFSAGRGHWQPPKDTTPPKRFQPRSPEEERGMMEEAKEMNKERTDVCAKEGGKPLDVFWFLKPCTTLSS